jgi:hypothetical protein
VRVQLEHGSDESFQIRTDIVELLVEVSPLLVLEFDTHEVEVLGEDDKF